jgi:hypothetical protein
MQAAFLHLFIKTIRCNDLHRQPKISFFADPYLNYFEMLIMKAGSFILFGFPGVNPSTDWNNLNAVSRLRVYASRSFISTKLIYQ